MSSPASGHDRSSLGPAQERTAKERKQQLEAADRQDFEDKLAAYNAELFEAMAQMSPEERVAAQSDDPQGWPEPMQVVDSRFRARVSEPSAARVAEVAKTGRGPEDYRLPVIGLALILGCALTFVGVWAHVAVSAAVGMWALVCVVFTAGFRVKNFWLRRRPSGTVRRVTVILDARSRILQYFADGWTLEEHIPRARRGTSRGGWLEKLTFRKN